MSQPGHDLERYLLAARELEEALRLNKADSEFANGSKQGKIVYIADTNVVVHYLEENRRPRHGIESGRPVRQGEFSFGEFLSEGVAAKVNDQLTVEYLLSGALPGQHGHALYLTPAHWNEILDRANDTARKLAKLVQAPPMGSMEKLVSVQDPAKKVEMARDLLPGWILEALKIAPALQRRLQLAFSETQPKLRALDLDETYWSDALSRLRTSDLRDWKARVLAAAAPRAAKTGRENTKNLDNDVQSLALIHAMYRENPEACSPSRTVQFLFVTADRSLYRAVEHHRDALEREGIPMFVRHPRVFSPLLNYSSMSRAGRGALSAPKQAGPEVIRVFEEVESTLDRLLVFRGAEEAANAARRSDQAYGELRASLDSWARAARQLALAQSHLFLFLESEAIQEAIALLQSPPILDQTRNNLIETIGSIRNRHVRFQLLGVLQRLARSRSKRRGLSRRAPIQIVGVDILEPLRRVLPQRLLLSRPSTLRDVLDHLASPSADAQLLEAIGTALLDGWEDPTTQLLAACLYLAAEAWASARDCAERCRNKPGVNALLRREADYLYALASRFMLDLPGVYQKANHLLFEHKLLLDHDKTPTGQLARLRYEVEHAALRGAGAMLQAIDDATPLANELGADNRIMNEQEIREAFDSSHRFETRACETLHADFSGRLDDRGAARLIETLRLQLYTNMVGTEVFRYSLGRRVSDDLFRADRLEAALKQLEQECEGSQPEIVQIYIAAARAILDRTSDKVTAAISLIEATLEDENHSACDRIEFRHLRDHLRLEISQAA